VARKFPVLIPLLFRLRFMRAAEYVLGDLFEEYNSGTRSRRWLWRQAFSLLLPGTPGANAPYDRPKGATSMNSVSSFWSDLCYAARTLRKNPGFTVVAVLAIALGIGVNTGIFTVLNGVALRPLPVHGASEVISIYQTLRGVKSRDTHGSVNFLSTSEYESYRDNNHVLSGLLAYDPFVSVTLGGDRPQQLMGQLTSCNYFDVLNEPPVLGRGFLASECVAEGAGPVVVLNHDLWRNVFGADPAIAGKKVVLNRQLLTVVGVAPQGFQGTEVVAAAFWAPITMQPALGHNFNWLGKSDASWLVVLGRTKPGVSVDRARADLGVIAGRIDQLTPGRKTSLQIDTASLLGMPEARKLVFGVGAVLLAAVGMVLLIACANVANLLLARAAGRHKEIAIRLSVGASRGRLVRQLLTESMLIAMVGGALGSLIAVWSFQGIVKFIMLHLPNGTPPLMVNLAPDFRVLGYAMIMTIVTGIVFGLAPALQASRPDLNSVLKDAGSGLVGRSGAGGFLRNALVGAQVCVCMVLLIGAGLLLRGLYVAQTIDPGFNLKNIVTVSFHLTGLGYDAPHAALFNRRLAERVAGLPGVDSVARTGVTPLSDSHRGTVFTLPDGGERQVEINSVSPEYFSMLGIPIVRGRNFTDDETRAGAPVTIATESTARRFWPGQDPIGKSIAGDHSTKFQVIGVARDTQVSHLARSNETYLYFPAGPKEQIRLPLLVHSSDGFASTAKGIQAAVRALDPDVVADVAKLEDNLELWRTPPRIFAILAGSLGALGLLLASIGVYGVVSYSVSGRIREIGLRMTLGADAREVMKLILRQAMRPVLIGAVIGIAGCAGVSTVLSKMLFGLSAHDPVSFIAVPLFLLAIALLASYIPARRATKVDPMVALRYE